MIDILVVEDEQHLCAAIAKALEIEGFNVVKAYNGREGLEKFSSFHFDLIVSDLMMPLMSGKEMVAKIREVNKEIPIILLTALDGIDDKVTSFNVGVDDYLVKPMHMKELVVRIRAMLRRIKINVEQQIILPSTLIDAKAQRLVINGEEIKLNRKQFNLLFKLISNPNVLFSREQLLNDIWGYDSDSTDRTVDVHINWIRNKAKSPDYEIVAVWGLGYKGVLNDEKK